MNFGSPIFIGLDGGGSRTRAIVVDEKLDLLGRAESDASNYLRVGVEAATSSLRSAIVGALREAGREESDVEWAYCGIAGSDHPVNQQILTDVMKEILPSGDFTIDSDARIALEGSIPEGPGVVVISGTGSVAFGRDESGMVARAGGWGPTLGDEGSGYAIARAGMTAIVRSSDGRGPQTIIGEILCRDHGLCSPADLRMFIYSDESDASRIAKLNQVVIDAARQDDHVALWILEDAGSELALSALAVARKLDLLDGAFRVSYVGGVFRAGALLLDPFSRELAISAPECTIHPPDAEPVIGAARLAIETWRSRSELN
ncbi:MAG: BadF/BadG/BcrA/BcrD ATPase family protein [Thermoanaerobaculia bacterium]|nr:BadF/BadG/BcrA/BcrD ATPase family protein [Thermoanaerobaculia bacterium]